MLELNTVSQSSGFWIPRAKTSRIQDSTSKNFPDPDGIRIIHVLTMSVLPAGRNYDLYVFSLGKVCLFLLLYRLLCFNNFNQTMPHVPFLKTYQGLGRLRSWDLVRKMAQEKTGRARETRMSRSRVPFFCVPMLLHG